MPKRKTNLRIKLMGPWKSTGVYDVRVVQSSPQSWKENQTGEWVCDQIGQCEIVLLDTPNKRWDAIHEVTHATFPDLDDDAVERLVDNLKMLSEVAPELWPCGGDDD